MRSFAIAVFILAVIIGGVIVSRGVIVSASRGVSGVLEEAYWAIEREDWEVAEEQFLEALELMRGYLGMFSILVDHREVEEVMLSMRMMERYLHQREVADAMAEGARALFWLELIERRTRFNLANIL